MKIFELSEEKVDTVLLERDDVYAKIHRDHPFKNHDKSDLALKAIIQSKIINSTFKLDK